ncbi:MAG: TraR/DksA family transcriptional regulator [Deltaproteobacteria bacterium]|nr:TraR/DksA family transcriptional regulator [Deltaproteobacteria bacterium]MCB9785237.1 TraR/DksA family transcriptional regulator [Deltaproteobacteria bacterium]
METLTQSQRATLEAALRELAAELEASLAQSRDAAQPVDLEDPIGRVSRMDAMQQQSMARASRHRATARLERVQAALRRMKAGEYGDCLRCDEPIGFGRLATAPEAATCVRCQSEIEASRSAG